MPRGRKPKNQTVNIVDTDDNVVNTETKEVVRYAGETSINHIYSEETCILYGGERWSYNLAKEMLKQHPDEVELLMEDTVDRSIEIRIPFKCMKYIKWPTTRNMSEEARNAAKERMSKAREARKKIEI